MSIVPQRPVNGEPGGPVSPYHVANRSLGAGFEESQNGRSFDFVGAIMRRKFIIILSCILGGIIGYLNFLKEEPAYTSWLKLMIWEQAPPSVVDGEWIKRRVSVSKHQNLLGSELVLSSAIENASLQNLQTFVGSSSPVSQLKDMLSISSIQQNDDTLVLSCHGPVAEDLPVVLNQIVHSYERILFEDSKSVGQESIALVEKLQQKLMKEQKEAEERYLELSGVVGPIANSDEKVINPHLAELARLKDEKLRSVQELKAVEQQLRLLREAAVKQDANLKELLVIEANKYLDIDTQVVEAKQVTRQDLLERKIEEFEALIVEKQLERQNVNPGVGSSHPQAVGLDRQLEFLNQSVAAMKSDMNQWDDSEESNGEEDPISYEDRLVNLYRTSLIQKQNYLLKLISSVKEQIDETNIAAAKVANTVVEINLLRSRIDEKREAIQIIFDRLSEIDLVSSDYNTVRVKTIDSPGLGRRVSPVLSKSIGYAVFLAGFIGLALALLIDRLDLTFRTSTEIADNLGVPVVGTIPRIRSKKPSEFGADAVLSAAHSPLSRVAESFRAVRTSLFFISENGVKNVFLFTSPSPGDGKSTITSNLAISIAQTGKRVCLVDADFRRPMLKKLFASERDEGMLDVMRGDCTLFEAVATSFQENLFVIGTGGRNETPGEVVTSPEFEEIINELRDDFDYVLIDSPPIGPVADASVISRMVDAVYLVLRIRKGGRVSATTAVENLLQVEADLKGIIVNDLDENPHYSDYGYQYSPYNGYGRYNYGYGGYGYGNQRATQQNPAPKAVASVKK